MDDEIDGAPLPFDLREQRLELARHGHVERRHDGRLHLLRQRLHVRPGLLIEPGHGQFGAGRAQRAGAAPGDALRIGDAHHQPPLALQRQVLLHGGRHAGTGRRAGHGVAACTDRTAPACKAAAQVASVTPPARAYGKAIGVWGCKVLHASGARGCIFMNLASVTEFRGTHQCMFGELVRGENYSTAFRYVIREVYDSHA